MHGAALRVAEGQPYGAFDGFAKCDSEPLSGRIGPYGEPMGGRTVVDARRGGGEDDVVGPVFAGEAGTAN